MGRFTRIKKPRLRRNRALKPAVAMPPVGAAGEFRALMEAAVDAIVVINESGRVLSFSPAAERLFGFSADEVIGEPVEMLMPEPYRSRHDGYIRRYRATGSASIIGKGREVEGRRRDGTVFPMWLSVGEVRLALGRRFVGIVRDLSEQRAAERGRYALEARLARVGRFSLMGEMATGIAHEINQPLSAIGNYAQAAKNLLDRGDLNGLKDACGGITEQVQRAASVVESIRSFIRKQPLNKEKVDLLQVVNETLELVAIDAREASIAVRTDLPETLPAVDGNSVQLQQVVLNLTRNAVDAIRDRGAGGRREIDIVTSAVDDRYVDIEVHDSGPGIAPSARDAVFEPFVTTKSDGLGVGLAISRRIVEAHGGKLTFEPGQDGGSVFRVRLPVAGTGNSTGAGS